MTIATDMGFEIGKHYRGKEDSDLKGCVFEFVYDDGSYLPKFKSMDNNYAPWNKGEGNWVSLDNLEVVPLETAESCGTSSNKPLLLLYIQQQYPNDKVLKALVESL